MSEIIDIHKPIPGAPNFSWVELMRTSHRLWLNENRRVSVAFQPAGEDLARLLQEIRDHYSKPLIVHSGYRGPGLNRSIGGSNTSQHMRFEAADFHVMSVPLPEVFRWIWEDSGLSWGQLIAEGYDPEQGDIGWIHISLGHPYRPEGQTQQVLLMSIRRREQGLNPYMKLQ